MHQVASDQTIGYVDALNDGIFGDDGYFDPSKAISAPVSKKWQDSEKMCDIERKYTDPSEKFHFSGLYEQSDPIFTLFEFGRDAWQIGGYIHPDKKTKNEELMPEGMINYMDERFRSFFDD